MGCSSQTRAFSPKAERKPMSLTEYTGLERDPRLCPAWTVVLRMCPEWSLGNVFCFPGGRSGTCKLKWTCCGENCYYFSKESKNFEDSKKFCERMDSKLVKIEDQQELVMCISCFPFYTICM